jgi:hypothetical protein
MGDSPDDPLRVYFDGQLKLEFHGSIVTVMPDCSPTVNLMTPSA